MKKNNIFILTLSFLLTIFLYFSIRNGLIHTSDYIDILVLGIDSSTNYRARADSINIIRIDFTNNKIGVLSIPRDLYVDIPGYGKDKINHSHFFGGPQLTCKTISKLFNTEIKYYVELNFIVFKKFVDSLGGITLDIKKPLHYDDYAANLHIHLFPGRKKLSGYEAMGYVRFRMDNASDWGRIGRQQEFLKALFEEISKPYNIVKYPNLFYISTTQIVTNLTPLQIVKLSLRGPSLIKNGTLKMGFIPGMDTKIGGIYYTIADEKYIKETFRQVILDL